MPKAINDPTHVGSQPYINYIKLLKKKCRASKKDIMRKFYVRYEYDLGGPQYGNKIIELEENEKANMETFFKKLNKDYIRILSWSLIEE